MAEHDKQAVEVAGMFGHSPNDVYGEPKADAAPEKFQEEIPSVEELLSELPVEAVEEVAVDAEEAPVGDIASLMARLQVIIDMEDVVEEDKTAAQDFLARLEETQAAVQNAEAFLAEKEPAVEVTETTEAVVEVPEEVAIV